MFDDLMDTTFEESMDQCEFEPFDVPFELKQGVENFTPFTESTETEFLECSQPPIPMEDTNDAIPVITQVPEIENLQNTRIRKSNRTTDPNGFAISKEYKNILESWYIEHMSNPYPTAAQKDLWSRKLGLTKRFINNYFTNLRRRKSTIIRKICRTFVNGH